MKKILALLCLCAAVGATMSAQGLSVSGTRICLLHALDWEEQPNGLMTVGEGDPYYVGGWNVSLVAGEQGIVTVEGGFTPHGVAQPLKVAGNVVTLEVNEEEPVATVSHSSTTQSGGVTVTVDSVMSYYVVNEAWWTDGAAMADIHGELLPDGSIHIADGFAYYIETKVTTTTTYKDGTSRTDVDETAAMSPVYRDLQLLVPNGKHEFTNEADGSTSIVDVVIRQDGDTVWVTNLYGYGAPEVYMLVNEDGEMTFPSQMIRDIPDEMSPAGSGVWNNQALMGGVTETAILWSQTTPTDGVQTWTGWNNNRLYYTDGTEFVIPGQEPEALRGDVNRDGFVTISDVTALINALLSGQNELTEHFSPANADCDQNGTMSISDVTALINYLLSHSW